MPANVTPVVLLKELDAHARAREGRGQHRTLQKTTEWRGLGFKIGETELIVNMDQVSEILETVNCTRIPWSRFWFYGIANVRGTLVPIMDVHGYLYDTRRTVKRGDRTILFRLGTSLVGLVVTGVTGLKNLSAEEFVNAQAIVDEKLAPYTKGHFRRGYDSWPVFDFHAFTMNEKFLDIAERQHA
ncbi:MAG: chemotaxis protein CheW [Gammaproteobacteria bacterium]|nr:chemotaxis protein CheW [Gammaproteobacteria bacterium]